MIDWLGAFTGTVLIEVAVLQALLAGRLRPGWTPFLAALAVNASTHPALWFAVPRFGSYATWLLVVESAIVVLETGMLAAIATGPRRLARAGLASALANGASLAAGLALRAIHP